MVLDSCDSDLPGVGMEDKMMMYGILVFVLMCVMLLIGFAIGVAYGQERDKRE